MASTTVVPQALSVLAVQLRTALASDGQTANGGSQT